MKKATKVSVFIILSILLVISAVGSYVAISFNNGKKSAESQVNNTMNNNFSGDKQTNTKEISIMFIGDDGRKDDGDEGRADTLMVGHYNSKTKQPKLISIMRDSYVNIPNYGMDKINAAYAYGGAQLTKNVLNDSFNLPINYYAVVDFNNFVKLIDDIYPKGVEIEAEKDINLDGVDILKGKQTMDGHTLLQYARFRKDEESDFGRVRRQQQVMNALAQQAKNAVPILELPKIAGEAVGYLDTNIPSDLLIDLAKDFLSGKVKNLETLSVPVEGTWDFNDYTEAGSVIEIDPVPNAQAVQAFLANGEKQ